MCGVAGVAHDQDCFAGEAGDIYVLRGGEWGNNDLSSCVHCALQGFPVVVSAAPAPHSDTAGQDALNGVPVECAHDGWRSSRSLEFAEEVEAPLCFLRQ